MTVNNYSKQKLRSKENTPDYVKNYRLSKTQEDEVDKQVSNLLYNDLFESSTTSLLNVQ